MPCYAMRSYSAVAETVARGLPTGDDGVIGDGTLRCDPENDEANTELKRRFAASATLGDAVVDSDAREGCRSC